MKYVANQSSAEKVTRAMDSAHGVTFSGKLSDAIWAYRVRLAEALKEISIPELSRRSGVSDSALRAYVDGDSLPGWENAVRIARTLGRSLDWFAGADTSVVETVSALEAAVNVTGQVARELQLRRSARALESDREFALLPLYDIRGGHGAWNDEERVSKMLAFRRDWLHAELGSCISDLILFYVDGDSMEPTLSSGDVVMVDRAQVEVRDGIYVWQDDGALMIKRLQRMAAGTVRVLSDNPRFPAYDVELAGMARVTMIGRVVWAGVKL